MSRRTTKLLARKSKYLQTMEERYGVEEARQMIQSRTSKAGSTKGKPKGFEALGSDKARAAANKRWAK